MAMAKNMVKTLLKEKSHLFQMMKLDLERKEKDGLNLCRYQKMLRNLLLFIVQREKLFLFTIINIEFFKKCRDGEVRTPDLWPPDQHAKVTAPHPEFVCKWHCKNNFFLFT
tara:strand:+ start:2457 stop:2789 length:333 start_codon:yes stop_codon:yes gene_type:complete